MPRVMYIRNLELLSAAEERALARRYRDTGDRAIAERLVRAHLRVVMVIARHYRFTGHDFRDLFQVGSVGLLLALAKYDPDRGVRLSSYAGNWIHAKILQFLWDNRRLVRVSSRQRPSRVRPPTEKETEAAAAVRRHLHTAERDLDLPLRAPDAARPDVLVEDAELRARTFDAVDRFADTLDERERAIFDARFRSEDPPTLASLGQRFGISRERARQLEAGLLGRLRNHVTAELGA
jgi:RNA polymerase sigma-32 factor